MDQTLSIKESWSVPEVEFSVMIFDSSNGRKLKAMKTVVPGDPATIRFLKRVCLFPRTIWNGLARLWRSGPLNAAEAERVDRICNPSKYLGKP